ncbi:MAG: hypothetical protein HZA66_22750 [Rhodopseudomonas palustris]|uniref:Uncharacterized protein n=1 Tax=Rhodopseudomonas palustris TaxID=1076 RepID=A0A933S1M4_RHOPL|nr:hypothetical protein [Rhodopseudomonas palustris]
MAAVAIVVGLGILRFDRSPTRLDQHRPFGEPCGHHAHWWQCAGGVSAEDLHCPIGIAGDVDQVIFGILHPLIMIPDRQDHSDGKRIIQRVYGLSHNGRTTRRD